MNKTLLLTLIILATLIPFTQAISVSGNSSVYTFNITCQADTPQVGCAPASITYSCQIDNPAFINYVEFRIANTWYNTTQNTNNFTTTITKPSQNATTNTTINLTQQKIHDTNGGYVNAFDTTTVINDCELCTPTVAILQACNTTNQEIVNLTYTPSGCSNDTVQEQACIYCTPTWQALTGGAYDCQPDGTKLQYYTDTSACCILSPTNCIYPIDHNTNISCGFYPTDMTCQYDQKPYLTSKINMICTLPSQYASTTTNCVTYVRKANQTLLIQSNPEYADPTMFTFWKEGERRTSFTNTGSVINAYYTDKLLETGQEFVLGMKCTTTNGSVLTSEYAITPAYKPPTNFLNRLVWASDNAAYVAILLIGLVLITLAIAWALKKVRGR